jgi:hypothetical protein
MVTLLFAVVSIPIFRFSSRAALELKLSSLRQVDGWTFRFAT